MINVNTKRVTFTIILVMTALLSFWLGRISRPVIETADVTQKWPLEIKAAMLSIEPWMKNAQIVRVGKYIIYAPTDKNTYKLRIVTDPLKKYIDLEENKIYIDFNTTNHDSISITDKDKDNSRRTISYDIFDDNDSIIGNVTDVGRDGQPDYKYMRGDGKEMHVKDEDKYIFVAGQWRHSAVKEKERCVIIDGKWKKVKFVKSRYELQ